MRDASVATTSLASSPVMLCRVGERPQGDPEPRREAPLARLDSGSRTHDLAVIERDPFDEALERVRGHQHRARPAHADGHDLLAALELNDDEQHERPARDGQRHDPAACRRGQRQMVPGGHRATGGCGQKLRRSQRREDAHNQQQPRGEERLQDAEQRG